MPQITYTAAGAVSTTLNLPNWVDQSTLIDPQTGVRWVGSYMGPFSRQPGTFDATQPQANPIAVNQDPPVLGRGKPITVTGASGSTGDPTRDVNRVVTGQVPGTNVVFNSRG